MPTICKTPHFPEKCAINTVQKTFLRLAARPNEKIIQFLAPRNSQKTPPKKHAMPLGSLPTLPEKALRQGSVYPSIIASVYLYRQKCIRSHPPFGGASERTRHHYTIGGDGWRLEKLRYLTVFNWRVCLRGSRPRRWLYF